MFKWAQFALSVVLVINVQVCLAFFDVASIASKAFSGVKTTYSFVKDSTYCSYTECCSDGYIIADVAGLKNALDDRLFGQHIAKQIVVDAIGGHFKHIHESEKPLVMSLHGSPGTGKNYIAEHVVRALYKNGAKSKYVHKYLGRIDFPLQNNVELYKIQLVNDIKRAVATCPKSLFIFDEVEKMPAGLFDSIVTLLDNHAYTKELDFRQSIFIFLSNVAGPEIAKKLKHLLDSGVWREQSKLHDFEQTLEISSYNLGGGLYRSEMIESHVVDHFVPFLPLELRHVEKCVQQEYLKYDNQGMLDESFMRYAFYVPSQCEGVKLIFLLFNCRDVLKEAVTFDETGLFSNNGCKRISKKVESMYYNRLRKRVHGDL
ncbi:torsin-like protein isoform X1 [Anopheles ziemanni]|uniref:torsin-like protein isoform X1 n=1 Tax=Anopheles coustani TaxID=139045 RepID=UPI0026582E98|nr:torsin-like protein isoform X1 [Anopheles coustani]XP_058167148.1 torsin-like protein isoform X1 [Anopheles ziemanni]